LTDDDDGDDDDVVALDTARVLVKKDAMSPKLMLRFASIFKRLEKLQ
jgi:hypothetical protein